MGPKAVPRIAHVTDDLPLAHRIPHLNQGELALMGIQRRIAVSVVNDAVISIGGIVPGEGDHPVLGGVNLYALGHADVGAGVALPHAVQIPPAKEGCDAVVAGHGPIPIAGRPGGRRRDVGGPPRLRLLQGLLGLRLLRGEIRGLPSEFALRRGDFRQQRPGLGPLLFQLRQMGLQLALGLGLLVTAGLEGLAGLGQLGLGGLELRHNAVTVLHDVGDRQGRLGPPPVSSIQRTC